MSGNNPFDESSSENNSENNISINISSVNDYQKTTSLDNDLNQSFPIQNGENFLFNNVNNNSESSFSFENALFSRSSTIEKIISPISNNSTKKGRKSKSDKRLAKHTKINEDNIIKKIKTALMNYINEKLNKNRRCVFRKFLKLSKIINENNKKDYNIKLMNMTIKEIYERNILRKIYDKEIRNSKFNSLLIQEIFYNNKDFETIKILNTKYIDFLNQSDTKENIWKIIKNKELKNNDFEDIESYMNLIKQCLDDYEDWFRRKPDRNYRPRRRNIDEDN